MPTVEQRERPGEVRSTVSVPDGARSDGGDGAQGGGDLVMPAVGREPDMLRSYARLSSRQHDLMLGFPWRQEDKVTVSVPAGLTVKRMPEARTVATPFGKFTLAARR